MSKIGFLREIFVYFKKRKQWWFLPIIFALLIAGLLVVLSESSVISPFIYAIF